MCLCVFLVLLLLLLLLKVPGPCDPEDLIDGIIFGAKYLGSTQIRSDKNLSTNARMTQAQEAVDRIKVSTCTHARTHARTHEYVSSLPGDILELDPNS